MRAVISRQSNMQRVCAVVLGGLSFCAMGCMPDPDRVLADYQEDAIAFAAAEAEAYGDVWYAGLDALWEGVRAAVVFVATADEEGIYHDLDLTLEQQWSQRWPGLVPMRTSRSPNDTLLVLQRPEFGPEGLTATVTAQAFIAGKWTTHTVDLQRVAGEWAVVPTASADDVPDLDEDA